MARTNIPATVVAGAYVAAGTLLPFTAVDVANGNFTKITGSELVIAWNTDGAVARTITFSSIADRKGRVQDIAADSLAIGTWRLYGPFNFDGWVQADGNLYYSGSNVALKVAVIKFA